MIALLAQCLSSKPDVIIAAKAATAPIAAVSERSVLVPMVAVEKPAPLHARISSLEKPPSGPAITTTGVAFPWSFQAENNEHVFSDSQRRIFALA